MSGHSRWQLVRGRSKDKDLSVAGRQQLIHYTEGYILACEDLMKDLQVWRESADSDRGPDYFDALISFQANIEESLASARLTLEVLTK